MFTIRRIKTKDEAKNILIDVNPTDILIMKYGVDLTSLQPWMIIGIRNKNIFDGKNDVFYYEIPIEWFIFDKNEVLSMVDWNFNPTPQYLPGYGINDTVYYHTNTNNNEKAFGTIIAVLPYYIESSNNKGVRYVIEHNYKTVIREWGELSLTYDDEINSVKNIKKISSKIVPESLEGVI